MSDLFVSYRRGDSAYALLLYDRLSAAFGRDRVFRDVEDIRPGQYFDDVIARSLKESRAVVAVVGPGWVRDLPRLKERQDWVRRELAIAIERRIRLFPVLVGGVAMPQAKTLPRNAADVTRANAITLADATFHRDVDALLTALGDVVRRRREPKNPGPPGPREERAAGLLRDQVSRLQLRAVELIQENKIDRALDELGAGQELLMLLMDWSPTEVILDLQLGYLYKTLGQAFGAAGDRGHADRYIDLAASTFERVRSRQDRSADPFTLSTAVNGLGNVYAERGQMDRALDMYRSAAEVYPANAYAWHDMFAALDQEARAGRLDVIAMRRALDNVRRTGAGQPGLSADHLADLEARYEAWAGTAAPAPQPPALNTGRARKITAPRPRRAPKPAAARSRSNR